MRTYTGLFVGLLLLLLHPRTEAQNLVTNGGFETGDFTGWSLSYVYRFAGTATVSAGFAHSGQYGAELAEQVFFAGGQNQVETSVLQQNLATQAGSSYALSFALIFTNVQSGNCVAYWNGKQAANISVPTAYDAWTNVQAVVAATGSTTLLEFDFIPAGGPQAFIGFDDVSVTALPQGYNRVMVNPANAGNLQFSYAGIAGNNYALDRSFSLSPVNWIAQMTNVTATNGVVIFTNAPNAGTNNFWRVRSVP